MPSLDAPPPPKPCDFASHKFSGNIFVRNLLIPKKMQIRSSAHGSAAPSPRAILKPEREVSTEMNPPRSIHPARCRPPSAVPFQTRSPLTIPLNFSGRFSITRLFAPELFKIPLNFSGLGSFLQ